MSNLFFTCKVNANEMDSLCLFCPGGNLPINLVVHGRICNDANRYMMYNITTAMKYAYRANITRTSLTQIYPQTDNLRSIFDSIFVLFKLGDYR